MQLVSKQSLLCTSEAYLEPSQTSKTDLFLKTVNSSQPFSIFTKHFKLVIWVLNAKLPQLFKHSKIGKNTDHMTKLYSFYGRRDMWLILKQNFVSIYNVKIGSKWLNTNESALIYSFNNFFKIH